MPEISEDLLQLEHKNCAFSFTGTSFLFLSLLFSMPVIVVISLFVFVFVFSESALLVCNKKESHSQFKKPDPDEKPMFNPLPPSQGTLTSLTLCFSVFLNFINKMANIWQCNCTYFCLEIGM